MVGGNENIFIFIISKLCYLTQLKHLKNLSSGYVCRN